MTRVYLDHLSFALGEETRTVDEAAALGRLRSTPAALKEAGFRQHHVSRPGTTAYTLAYRATARIRDRLDGVRAIIYATCLPANATIGDDGRFRDTGDVKHLMDFPASHLQHDFGLDDAIVIGLTQQACTGVLGALRLARMLLLAEPDIGRALCVSADRYPAGALYEQAYNLVSDGAVACVLSTDPGPFELLASHAITNGALVRASDEETVGSYFTYTHRVIHETLAKAGLAMTDIAWIVPQNTHAHAWRILCRLLDFDFERVHFPTLGDVGHVISGDNIINLESLVDAGLVRPGDRVLLVMAGYGLNWQCAILEGR